MSVTFCDINPFARLISDNQEAFLGTSLEDAARNAANRVGQRPDQVPRFIRWPAIEKFDTDVAGVSPSPFAGVPNPEYLWNLPAFGGQSVALAASSRAFSVNQFENQTFVTFLAAFADNAMEAKILLFRRSTTGTFVKVASQPAGLGDFLLVAGQPNNPQAGLTETAPFNWQNIRIFSTEFTITTPGTYRIVIAFRGRNYFVPATAPENPAAIQFMLDLYRQIERFGTVCVSQDVEVETIDESEEIEGMETVEEMVDEEME